jgi:hypothetical protein
VRSTSEPGGVPVVLMPSGVPGTFTGSVATVTTSGPGLQIAHGDDIESEYFDASANRTRLASARGDLLPPNISNVGTSNFFGNTVVFWITDEAANSIVRYGTNATLSVSVTNGFRSDEHSVALPDLVPGRTYYYVTVSEDEAGNVATNDNGGALFTFVAATAPTVLLVENYLNDDFGAGPDIPLSVYTDTLTQIGVSFDVWDMTDGSPAPLLGDLAPYRVVMWRVSDNVFLNNTLSPAEHAESCGTGDGSTVCAARWILLSFFDGAVVAIGCRFQEQRPSGGQL